MATNLRPIPFRTVINNHVQALYQEDQEPLISLESLRAIRHVTSYPSPDAIIDQFLRRKIGCQRIQLIWYYHGISVNIITYYLR